MSELISGKEALIAWYDGLEVEVNYAEKGWKLLIFPTYGIDVFKSENHTFRLKPRTITLNSIEVPCAKMIIHSGGNCVTIACHSIEDAVATHKALRSIFNAN